MTTPHDETPKVTPILDALMDAPTLLRMLESAGYNLNLVHPAAFVKFDYLIFAESLLEYADRNRLRAQFAGVVKRCAKAIAVLERFNETGVEKWLILRNEALAILRDLDLPAAPTQAGAQEPVYVIFDGPPSHESGRFVEVETSDGKSVRVGEWKQEGAYWKLGPLYASPQAPERK